MKSTAYTGLPQFALAVIMRACMTLALLAALCLFATERTLAQDQPRASDELDVTMQIIVDPDAKLPDEVIRKIPLPARRPEGRATSSSSQQQSSRDSTEKGLERANEARELGSEMSERAKERKDEAAEQREEARRATAEERERGPPDEPPGRPPNPPGR